MNVRIETQILSGNVGDDWFDERDAARAFADFLEVELRDEARNLFGDDAAIEVQVDMQHGAGGAGRPLSVIAHDEDGLTFPDYQDYLADRQHEAWSKWLETEGAAALMRVGDTIRTA